jgi:hypothetical protein
MQSVSRELEASVRETAWTAVRSAVWDAVWDAVRFDVRDAVWSIVRYAVRKEVRNAMVEKGDLTQYRGCRKAICDCVRDVRSERCCLGWRD